MTYNIGLALVNIERRVMKTTNADGCGCCIKSLVNAPMGEGTHTAGRGAGVGSERADGEQAKMDDGWC